MWQGGVFAMQIGTRSGLELRQTRRLAMTGDLRRAIGFLRLDNAELGAELAMVARRNPALVLAVASDPTATRARGPAHSRQGVGIGGGTAQAEAMPAAGSSGLEAHAAGQVALILHDPEPRRIGLMLAEALEPSGWLGMPLGDIARRIGCDVAKVETVLVRLQNGVEPAGLFARNLAECLRIQAADRGMLDAPMEALLCHLDLLARGRLAALAELCGVSEADVAALAGRLRRLDPKPGAAFGAGPAPVRPPDVIVTAAEGGGWHVDMNDATTPRVSVQAPGDATPDTAAEREAALAEAQRLCRAVARRNATVLAVVSAAVALQDGFLRHGAAAIRPLTRAAVAERAGVHETTVCRVAAGLLVSAPLGTYPLRDFFGASLAATGDGAPVAAGAVRHRIAALIREESGARPLSDAALSARLHEEGIVVARRTVAKYRESLGLASASVRRARARLKTAAARVGQRVNPSR